ncbi:MAG: ROK family protein [Kiritimatiellaeota bacterium]|nr:ROK family protein [Kiritimatiellota bacterium]
MWNRAFLKAVDESGAGRNFKIALKRPNGSVSVFETRVLSADAKFAELNFKYAERLLKFLLWMKGGNEILIAGAPEIADKLKKTYSKTGCQAFDNEIIGIKMYDSDLSISAVSYSEIPEENEGKMAVGGNFDGCRIGFDLGGSDRKYAVLMDGEVVHSEEIEWNPYFEKDTAYHLEGIRDTLRRAASHLPRVDAIGGSSAGCYVDNKVRVASLFRGVSEEDFKKHVVNMFLDIQKEWDVPLVVVNDGEVTALAGAAEMNDTAVLGISMGTSLAAGFVTPAGNITDWLNELAFVPVDYASNAPADEWSKDIGCGVQYFSQQGVARLAAKAGLDFKEEMPPPERLVEIQKLMSTGDSKSRGIYETIGIDFGYTLAHFADFYDFRNLLILGRVTSGDGGQVILDKARAVLDTEFPELSAKIAFKTPDEKNKRHGQAVAAAGLPKL